MGSFSHKPVKSTTGSARSACSGRPRRRGLANVWGRTLVPLLVVAVLAAGCTSARKRESPTNLVGNLKFRDSTVEDRFAGTYRSGSLYQDFRTVMLADAIAMDQEYRRDYVEALRKAYLLSDADVRTMQEEQAQDFDNTMSLLLFLFGGNNRPIPLGDPKAQWKVVLRDDDGQVLTPAKIEKLRPDSPTFHYLSLYFYGMDRWAEGFRISFPKLNKTLTHQPIGSQPVELIVTGLDGTIRMDWNDPRVFYGEGAASASAGE